MDDGVKGITDLVHHRIYLPANVLKITTTRQWRRMHHVKQLSFVFELYQSATHTRAQHMMGAAHLARYAGKNLQRLHPSLVSDVNIRVVTIAALVHDIGHGPFSHEFETACHAIGLKFDHEEMTLRLLDAMCAEYPSVKALLDAEGWAAVKQCIVGGTEGPASRWQVELISGNVDVDKLDYTVRDFTHIGVSSSMDTVTSIYILDHMHISPDGGLVFDVCAIKAIVSLYNSRMKLHEDTCMHHTVLGMKMLLQECIAESPELNRLIVRSVDDPEEFIKLVDTFLLTYLNTTTERGRGYDLAHMIQFDRAVPTCLGIVSSNTICDPPEELKALVTTAVKIMTVCIGFGKTRRNVLHDIDFINRDGESVVIEDLIAQTVLPASCIVFKHYIIVKPFSTLSRDETRAMQDEIKKYCQRNEGMVWTRRPLSASMKEHETLE